MQRPAFFDVDDDDRLIPTSSAESLWAAGTLNGPAVCAAAARATERAFTEPGFRPARFTIELFRAARGTPLTTSARMVRDGRRIKVVEIEVRQSPRSADAGSDPASAGAEEVVVARSTTVMLRTSSNPPGERWSRPDVPFGQPATDIDDPAPWFGSDDPVGTTRWTTEVASHQTDQRKRLWTRSVPVVPGEELSPFARAVISGESTSLVCNWGSTGIGFINCDLTVALSRLPVGPRVGVVADSHIESDGVSVGTAALHDENGQFGMGMVTAVNNAAAEIDFTRVRSNARYPEA